MSTYSDYIEYLKHVDNTTKEEIDKQIKALNDNINALKSSLTGLQKEKDVQTTELAQLQKKLTSKNDMLNMKAVEIDQHLRKQTELNNTIDSLKEQEEKLNTSLEQEKIKLQQKITEIEEKEQQFAVQKKELDSKIIRLQTEYNELLDKQVSTDSSAAMLKRDLEALQGQLNQETENTQYLKIEINNLNRQKEILNQKIAQHNNDSAALQKELKKQLEEANNKTKRLKEELNEKIDNEQLLQEEIKKLNEQNKILYQKIGQNLDDSSALQKELKNQLKEANEKVKKIKEELNKETDNTQQLQDEINNLKEQNKILYQKIGQNLDRSSELEKQLSEANNKIEKLHKEKENLNKKIDKGKQFQVENDNLNEQNNALLQRIKKIEKESNDTKLTIKETTTKNIRLKNECKELQSTISSLQLDLEKQKKTKKSNFFIGLLLGLAILSFIWFISPNLIETPLDLSSVSPLDLPPANQEQVDVYGYTEDKALPEDKAKYTGQTKYDIPHGIGTKEFSEGGTDKFVGAFKEGEFYYGVRSLENGKIYTGPYVNNQANGVGSYQFGDGSLYIGEFKNGAMNGYGIYIDEKGNKTMGEFKNNNLVKGSNYGN